MLMYNRKAQVFIILLWITFIIIFLNIQCQGEKFSNNKKILSHRILLCYMKTPALTVEKLLAMSKIKKKANG